MAQKTKIEWSGSVWNPVRGCDKVSPGCKNCYAETFAERFRGSPGNAFEFGFDLRLAPHKLNEPLHLKDPDLIFVNSMSDLFHEGIPDDYVHEIFEVMRRAHWHQFQILTKRSERLLKMSPHLHWPSNVWMGVSIESKAFAHRIDALRKVPAAIRFLSVEPMLGAIPNLNLKGIHWVIGGGESGWSARPMLPDWARGLRDQCQERDVPFFFKQWGTYAPVYLGNPAKGDLRIQINPDGTPFMQRLGKERTGRILDGRTWDEMPTKREQWLVEWRILCAKRDAAKKKREDGVGSH